MGGWEMNGSQLSITRPGGGVRDGLKRTSTRVVDTGGATIVFTSDFGRSARVRLRLSPRRRDDGVQHQLERVQASELSQPCNPRPDSVSQFSGERRVGERSDLE